jgi:hypothetical protein
LCPTCRTECFADGETGEPSIHRLFINFGEEGDRSRYDANSSEVGSSPIRGAWTGRDSDRDKGKGKGKEKEKEKEVIGLARRARNIGEEVKDLRATSGEGEVNGMLRRAEGLRDDVISDKALSAIKVSNDVSLRAWGMSIGRESRC